MPKKYYPEKVTIIAFVAVVTVGSAMAGEKVRFGPSRNINLPTQPIRSARETIEMPAPASLGQVSGGSGPLPAMAVGSSGGGSTVVRKEDEDEKNWIFRDTSTANGIKKALGVETYSDEKPTMADRDSVAVIQEYFSRQKSKNAGIAPNSKNSSDLGGNSALDGTLGNSSSFATGTAKSSGADIGISANIFGGSSFENTLNSDNAAVRRYYRDLYTPSSGNPTLQSPAGRASLATGPGSSIASGDSSLSFSSLADKAAVVNSLSAAGADGGSRDPRLTPNTVPQGAAAAAASGNLPTVNEGNLFEKRNGLIEIPSRKF
ncbi:hypothetical protein GC207_01925 [bacterium]|nr:hypothetical protein [bacterium]